MNENDTQHPAGLSDPGANFSALAAQHLATQQHPADEHIASQVQDDVPMFDGDAETLTLEEDAIPEQSFDEPMQSGVEAEEPETDPTPSVTTRLLEGDTLRAVSLSAIRTNLHVTIRNTDFVDPPRSLQHKIERKEAQTTLNPLGLRKRQENGRSITVALGVCTHMLHALRSNLKELQKAELLIGNGGRYVGSDQVLTELTDQYLMRGEQAVQSAITKALREALDLLVRQGVQVEDAKDYLTRAMVISISGGEQIAELEGEGFEGEQVLSPMFRIDLTLRIPFIGNVTPLSPLTPLNDCLATLATGLHSFNDLTVDLVVNDDDIINGAMGNDLNMQAAIAALANGIAWRTYYADNGEAVDDQIAVKPGYEAPLTDEQRVAAAQAEENNELYTPNPPLSVKRIADPEAKPGQHSTVSVFTYRVNQKPE